MLTNSSNKTNFRISVPSGYIEDLGSFILHIQSGETPGFTIPITDHASGPKGIGRAHTPGSAMEYEPSTIRVLCDEGLESYMNVYKWMMSINNPNNANRYSSDVSSLPFIQYQVLNNVKNDIVMNYNLIYAWPSNLSSLEYDYTEEGDPAITFTVTLNYRRVEIEHFGISGR